MLWGCACGEAPPASSEPTQPEPAADAALARPRPVVDAGDEDEVLPAFNDEALAARFEAQRAFLRDDSLFEDAEGRAMAPTFEPDPSIEVGSVEDDQLLALPGSAGYGMGGGGSGDGDDTAANGNALGLYVPIEHPRSGPALARFHQALRDLRAGNDPDGKVRILVYGGSHTQADIYSGYMRAYLQNRFGDGGTGYVSMVKVNRWYHYHDWSIEQTKGWNSEHAQRGSSRKDGFYGLLGASGSSDSKRDRTKVLPRHSDVDAIAIASQYELFFLAQPDGGTFSLWADGRRVKKKIKTASENYETGIHAFALDTEAGHEIEVRPVGDGEVRLFGLTMEREQPGVVVDTLGISGTRAANMLHWDEATWSTIVRRRDPVLYTLFYGTNEATDENQPMADYEANLRGVLERLQRAAPHADCLLIGPGDFPREVEEGVWIPRPRLEAILQTQRDVAYEMGCGFWDTRAFMGGVGSMHTWATAQPRMASKDHIHFTKRGYVRLGMAVTDAMMADFDRE